VIKKLLTIPVTTFLLFSCVQNQGPFTNSETTETKTILSNYGHLNGVSKYKTSPLFLSTLKKDQTYRICLSENLVKKYPGVQSEVEAAVNIWAHYIDRHVPLEIRVRKLPFPGLDWSTKEYQTVYEPICGEVDLYVGEDHPKGRRLGYTKESLRYYPSTDGQHEVSSFIRVLNITSWPSTENKKFISLEQATNQKRTAAEVFELLLKRDKRVYLPQDETYLTLKTIVHEFGHVWGLCDQYPLEGGRTNCDPNHSTLSPDGHIIIEEDAMMGAGGWINDIGLHDDDIMGIIDLAQRSDVVNAGWEFPSRTIDDFPKQKEYLEVVKFLHLNELEITETGSQIIKAAMDITGPFKIQVQVKEKGSNDWKSSGAVFSLRRDTKTRGISLKVRSIDLDKTKQIRLVYYPDVSIGSFPSDQIKAHHISNTINIQRENEVSHNMDEQDEIDADLEMTTDEVQ